MSRVQNFLTALMFIVMSISKTSSDIYTSSKKIEDMVMLEEALLNQLHSDVSNLGDDNLMSYFTEFYSNRLRKAKEQQTAANLQDYLKHPNGVYLSIKQFAAEYKGIRSLLNSSPSVSKHLNGIATDDDLAGARRSFLRLQTVYGFEPAEMVKGEYLGYSGPGLSVLDAFQIGQTAFAEGEINASISWLNATYDLKRSQSPGSSEYPSEGQILALLGRAYLRLNEDNRAVELYKKAYISDPTNGDVFELNKELVTKPRAVPKEKNLAEQNFARLCTLQNKPIAGPFDGRHVCFYRPAVSAPYYRFKQEVLSTSPYVALFYDVLSDKEGEYIVDIARGKLNRGTVERSGSSIHNEGRTSDLSFIFDKESELVKQMGKRVGAITGLDTSQDPSGFPYVGEPFQVVNYGMGGHYGVHLDPFDEVARKNNAKVMADSGNRLATFLIYLSDVEKGGSTAFVNADIVVQPVKNMALFWYSFTPAGDLDEKTFHAGCPVVVGHKWVTNKWIWTYGNTFTRRCGLRQNSTQIDIDKYMINGWA